MPDLLLKKKKLLKKKTVEEQNVFIKKSILCILSEDKARHRKIQEKRESVEDNILKHYMSGKAFFCSINHHCNC